MNTISCPICYENFSSFRIPICLICGHTICIICLNESLEKNEDGDEDIDNQEIKVIRKCLVCRTQFITHYKNMIINKSILNAIYHKNILEQFVYCHKCDQIYEFNKIRKFSDCVLNNHNVHSIESLVKIYLHINDQSKCFYNNDDLFSMIRELLNSMKKQIAENKGCITDIITKNFGNSIFNTLEKIPSVYTNLENISNISKNKIEFIKDLYDLETLDLYKTKKGLHRIHKALKMYDKLKNKTRNETLNILQSNYKYYSHHYDNFERKYSVQMIPETKQIILINAKELILSKNNDEVQAAKKILNINELPGVLNYTISIEVNNTGEEIYFVGGVFGDEDKRSSDFFIYNVSLKILVKMPEISQKLKQSPILYHKSKLILIGGIKNNEDFSEICEYFDFNFGIWENLPQLTYPLGNPTLCTVDDVLYVCGNYTNSESAFFSLDLNVCKNWNRLVITLDVCLSGNIFAPLGKNKFIIFGGVIENDDKDNDYSFYYNEKYYVADILNNSVLEEDVISNHASDFRCNPAIYKFKLYAIDCENDNENNKPLLYCFDMEKNLFLECVVL
jgi:hypothetical protein